jgi:site-specific recombinase XerD
MSDGLEPTTPAEAVEWYLEERKSDLSEKSQNNHRYRLEQFVEFCSEHDIENPNTITGRDLHRFRTWRSKDIKPVTLRGELNTLRVFLGFCANIEAVESGMRERVKIPNVDASDEAREVHLDSDRAESILDHLERFAYASRDHVVMAILWHTGIRLGSLRTFDVRDFDSDQKCLDLRHRPDTETPLKNKQAAERSIAVGSHYCDVIQDYIDHNRHDVVDDHNCRPLITSSRGRLSDGSIRETIYKLTQPCDIGECRTIRNRRPASTDSTVNAQVVHRLVHPTGSAVDR